MVPSAGCPVTHRRGALRGRCHACPPDCAMPRCRPFPGVVAWMGRMEQLPFAKEANMANAIIGDLTDGVEKATMGRANKESTKAILGAIARL